MTGVKRRLGMDRQRHVTNGRDMIQRFGEG